mmetsp:Transcript_25277/g.25019  ORF Transcript_25277/g.25019 Transcript_25277/m.25019 type:complete len:99 (-) Transcript_25277:31-327(-)
MVAVYVKADFVAAKEAARECLKTEDYFTSSIERENQVALGVGRSLAGALMVVYRVNDLASCLTKMIGISQDVAEISVETASRGRRSGLASGETTETES